MIQVILKDGTKKRFTDKIIGIDEKEIAFQKVLTDDEILKMPVIENNKMIFVEPPEPEQEVIDTEIDTETGN